MIYFGIDAWSDEFLTEEYHTNLQNLLIRANTAYRNGGKTGLEDCVYDRLYKLCIALDAKYPHNVNLECPTHYVGKKI